MQTGSFGTKIPVKKGLIFVDCLFDTGSPLNLTTHCTYEKIGKPCLYNTTMKFRGFGGNEFETKGVFKVDMRIDCNQCREVFFYLVPNENAVSHEMLSREIQDDFVERRNELRMVAKPTKEYRVEDLVAVPKTQYGVGQKFKPRYYGPY
uniref:Peptidase A2 domain-containing protein n=1 Tax=Anopheles stephensi TaxID=30069 RepID=A0A182YR36_ANOST